MQELTASLTPGEFIADLRDVVTSPAQRFALIRERGALWGSLLLLLIPAYFAFHFAGWFYFERDPFPGYSFLIPLVPALVLVLLKFYFIHVVARLFEGNGRYGRGQGRFYDLLSVVGYTAIPQMIAFGLMILLFLTLPPRLVSSLRDYRVATISALIAVGVVLFVWALILAVLAMRVVYRMRDLKIVAALILGNACAAAPAYGVIWLMHPVKIEAAFVRPILSRRFLQFTAPEPVVGSVDSARIDVHVDRVAYRFKEPRRFDQVAYRTSAGRAVLGRIVGLPGETVALREGRLFVNGQAWDEPHIPEEFQAPVTLQATTLGPTEYQVLPCNRALIEQLRGELRVDRKRLLGRHAIKKWPLGVLFFRDTAFLTGAPGNPSSN